MVKSHQKKLRLNSDPTDRRSRREAQNTRKKGTSEAGKDKSVFTFLSFAFNCTKKKAMFVHTKKKKKKIQLSCSNMYSTLQLVTWGRFRTHMNV